MIQYWRQTWNSRTGGITATNFPFGFVQVSQSIVRENSTFYDLQLSTNERTGTVVGGFPWIRWYQTFGVGYVPNTIEPNVFMAVALDLRDDDGK